MTKYFVKKPYLVFVLVVIVLTVGVVSLMNMQEDLLPEFELPYLAVIATDPGASPEQVQSDVTSVLESQLGTVNGVDTVTSTSSSNYAIVMLQFEDDTDMDSAMVRVSRALDSVELPDGCGKPSMMEISMDMMATMYASVEYDGKDIKDLSTFVNDVVKPYVERQDGVASVTASGIVEDTIEIRLDQDKIDTINDKILAKTNKKLKEAQEKIDDGKKQLEEGKAAIEQQEKALEEQEKSTNSELAEGTVKINTAIATKAAYEANLTSLQASKTALEAEKKAYDDAKLTDKYDQINDGLSQMYDQMAAIAKMANITVPKNIDEAVADEDSFNDFIEWVKNLGVLDDDTKSQLDQMTYENLKQIYDIVNTRIPQIDTELANLNTEIAAAQAVVDTLNEQIGDLDDSASDVYAGGYSAAAGFGSGTAQLAAAKTQLEETEKELESATQQLEDSRQAAIDNSNIDQLLTLDTLSSLIYAQNFSMPAGYVDDKDSNQWLVDVGDAYTSKEDIENMVLTKVAGIGKIKVSDVATITLIDNEGESYSKMNGEYAVILSIFKASTAGTNDVSENLKDAFTDIEEDYDGLSITPLMNQGDYIVDVVDSVLSSILLGAILAIIVLAIFLMDARPTLVVAFSIPFSVMFAIILMYFTGININIMSLGGLCISIGMLVDNSIVVMENIYRLRSHGISAARAAVQGTKQVAGPIIASTVTTICVFLPMVYTTGTVSDLLMPFAFTISYALFASLAIALTIVPTMGSVLLKNTKQHKHGVFDKVTEIYGRMLDWCLSHKIVPLAIAVILLAVCILRAVNTGLVLIDGMESDQISVTLTLEDDVDKDTAYATADKVSEAIMSVDGVDKVGVLDANATAAATSIGVSSSNYSSFTYTVLTDSDIKSTADFAKVRSDIEEATKDIDYKEISVSSSAMGSMSSLMGSGVTVNIYGDDQQELISLSDELVDKLNSIDGLTDASNGLDQNSKQIHLKMKKDKIAASGLTVAQIYQTLASKMTTEKTAISIDYEGTDVDVNIVDETDVLTYENILDTEIEATTMNDSGEQVTKTYKLSRFATVEEEQAMDTITRTNQSTYLAVSADVEDGYNATLLSREVQNWIDEQDLPDGYTMEISGNTTQVMDMVYQMLQALALGALLVYLVMVAQFQSLLSPFIIIFTIPLAFTGGMIGLTIFGQSISALALMGFMILMGTVVNNGIVFVDYANQLRIKGVSKRTALIATGKNRMRPILMTALTTILSMSVMVFSTDAGNAMQRSMAIVVCFGLIYATLMTLFIVPVLYDILYRKQPKEIDTGSENLDDIPDETSELLAMDAGNNILSGEKANA